MNHPFEKYESKWESSPKFRVKIKNIWNHKPRYSIQTPFTHLSFGIRLDESRGFLKIFFCFKTPKRCAISLVNDLLGFRSFKQEFLDPTRRIIPWLEDVVKTAIRCHPLRIFGWSDVSTPPYLTTYPKWGAHPPSRVFFSYKNHPILHGGKSFPSQQKMSEFGHGGHVGKTRTPASPTYVTFPRGFQTPNVRRYEKTPPKTYLKNHLVRRHLED